MDTNVRLLNMLEKNGANRSKPKHFSSTFHSILLYNILPIYTAFLFTPSRFCFNALWLDAFYNVNPIFLMAISFSIYDFLTFSHFFSNTFGGRKRRPSCISLQIFEDTRCQPLCVLTLCSVLIQGKRYAFIFRSFPSRFTVLLSIGRQEVSRKRLYAYPCTKLHGVTYQKTFDTDRCESKSLKSEEKLLQYLSLISFCI